MSLEQVRDQMIEKIKIKLKSPDDTCKRSIFSSGSIHACTRSVSIIQWSQNINLNLDMTCYVCFWNK